MNVSNPNDAELFAFVREHLYVAAVSDILDSLDRRGQVMSWRLRPLLPDMKNCGFVGRARTVRWVDIDHVNYEDPYGLEIDMVDSLQPNDVVVHATDWGRTNAPWGELMSTAAKYRGAVGCICDSQVRDCVKIVEMGFPVYYTGIQPLDSQGRGRVSAYDEPVRCGDVLVNPGEIVFADFDGIVVIPKDLEEKVFEMARERVGKESETRAALLRGDTLRQVYEKFGVL
jgi:4-hydroxy-4-methyl-2-oxoglutarate aldolase